MPDIIPFETVDYISEAQARVTEQFKDNKHPEKVKDVFNRYLKLLLQQQIEIQDTLKDLMQLRDIDNAVGVQLDVIGRIVGQPRILVGADIYPYFGFTGAAGAQTFGQKGTGVGGKFKSKSSDTGSNIKLDDEDYRKFLRAKIFKNITSSTPEEYMTVIKAVFGLEAVYIEEGEFAEFTVYFSRPLSEFEKSLLLYVANTDGYPTRLVPKTIGVQANYDHTGIPNFTSGYGKDYGGSYGA